VYLACCSIRSFFDSLAVGLERYDELKYHDLTFKQRWLEQEK